MENLPRDVALDILARLPTISLIRIKSVSKSWRALAQDPSLPSMYQERANTRNPCLLLHNDHFMFKDELCFVSLCDRPEEQYYNSKVKRINTRLKFLSSGHRLVGSCNGVLCISDASYFCRIFVWKPFTGDFIELPKPFKYRGEEVALGFGYHPTTEEYKLVRLTFYDKTHPIMQSRGWTWESEVQVLTLGDDSWRSLGPVIPWRVDPRASVALLNGALHWVTKRYNEHSSYQCLRIISFDLAEEKFKEIERPICGSLDDCNYHLVILGECLSAVHCLDDAGLEIWIMKEYNVKESWSKDYVIGTYLPSSMKQNSGQNSEMWEILRLDRSIKVVCNMKNGEILLEYQNRALVLYNPEREEFKDLVISGQPNYFKTIAHVESLLTAQEILRCKYEHLERDSLIVMRTLFSS